MPEMKRLICLDPGHGGVDPGAIGQAGIKEADINLAVAMKLKTELAERGIPTVMTRDDDTFVSLQDRASKANAANAAVFISLHCNSAQNREANGAEVYYCIGSRPGEALANAIHASLIKATGLVDRGVKGTGFYVLRHTKMPAVLVELAFISNSGEEELLANEGFQLKAARAIASGIIDYLKGARKI
ncbi:MAG: N-acetylmuramoyl-L-alanine amidase [Firmicutes bacterium]|nr:N-acetylmuramoyl-L-alanine amidase [Bacillota bacterium]